MEPSEAAYRRLIHDNAVAGKPRLFTVFGTMKRSPDEPLIGWGMQLPDEGGVLFCFFEDSTVHSSDTPERLLEVLRIIGDVDLEWLDS
ncbi:hypothetical protein ACFWY9_19570 [Amycolatopsis sp. NPDC059027]|uniref:hypothetical protein n=1 Tax=unclassified Amycolatopsis TaxID=2618356 RepID=UPI00366E51A1